MTKARTQLDAANKTLEAITKQIPRGRSDEIKELRKQTSATQDSVKALLGIISPPRDDKAQGITPRGRGLQSKVSSAQYGLAGGFGQVSGNTKLAIALAEKDLAVFLEKVDLFFTTTWPDYKKFIQDAKLSPFTDSEYKALKW